MSMYRTRTMQHQLRQGQAGLVVHGESTDDKTGSRSCPAPRQYEIGARSCVSTQTTSIKGKGRKNKTTERAGEVPLMRLRTAAGLSSIPTGLSTGLLAGTETELQTGRKRL